MTDQTIAAIATARRSRHRHRAFERQYSIGYCGSHIVTRHGIRPSTLPGYSVRYGRVVDPVTNRTIDEAILLVMRAPRSYTGEDVVEFQCHGGVVVVQRSGGSLTRGARLAEPGEFPRFSQRPHRFVTSRGSHGCGAFTHRSQFGGGG